MYEIAESGLVAAPEVRIPLGPEQPVECENSSPGFGAPRRAAGRLGALVEEPRGSPRGPAALGRGAERLPFPRPLPSTQATPSAEQTRNTETSLPAGALVAQAISPSSALSSGGSQ